MPRGTSYSFVDVSCIVSHPLIGQRQFTGESSESVTVAYTDDRTQSAIAADGSVMHSKIVSSRGTVTLELQQTSTNNTWLTNAVNVVDNASTPDWSHWTITIVENFDNGIKTVASYCALQKRPDRKDAQNGDNISWPFLAMSIAQEVA